jgi:hypothetical protein
MTNTNSAQNATHSVAITEICGQWIVSAYELGADGEPDMDRQVFERSLTWEGAARAVYRDACGLLKCSASAFRGEVDAVMNARASLGSCLNREVANEARILSSRMRDLAMATLGRRNAELEALRASVLASSAALIESRMSDIDVKIQAESARRAELGQP